MAQRKNSGRTTARAGRENRNASATKAGPGRFHSQQHEKATPPKHAGASQAFVLHKAGDERKERRNMIKTYGRRQGLKAIKYWRSSTPFFDTAAEQPFGD